MCPPAYLFQAPVGIPGDIVASDETNVEPAMLVALASVFAQSFGIPMVYVTGGIQQYSSGKVAADFAGILVREVPSIAGSSASDSSFDGTVPNSDFPQGLCVRGYINVKCAVGTPARGGVVWVRVAASSGHVIGDLETADAGGGATVALSTTQATWGIDGKDSDNNTTIRIAR